MAQSINQLQNESRYVINEREANRLKNRHSNMGLFQQIQVTSVNNNDPKARAPHCFYLYLIGFVPGLNETPCGGGFQSEFVENYIDKAVLYQNINELVDKREEYAVFEDNLAPTLEKMMRQGTQPSFSLLRQLVGNLRKKLIWKCIMPPVNDHISIL